MDMDLVDWIKSTTTWSENTRDKILNAILDSVSHLHEHNFVHRDIKLENICMRSGMPVLVDIDNCSIATSTMMKGTRDYMPTLQVLQVLYMKRIDLEDQVKNKWLDCYALGKTIAYILCIEISRKNSVNIITKIWWKWLKNKQSSLRAVIFEDTDLFVHSRWWKVVCMFCKYNEEAVFDSKKKIKVCDDAKTISILI
jgi:serine/threonine protein kinase